MTYRLKRNACQGMICIETSSQSELVEHAMRWGLDRRGCFTRATCPLKPNKSEHRRFIFPSPAVSCFAGTEINDCEGTSYWVIGDQ
jgi:hypothetical protein